MPSAFSSAEQQSIRRSLLESARRYAKSTGMKNVTVEDLTRDAGISKGAFYRFYETKELLFLDMMEEFCKQIAARLTELRKTLGELPPEAMSEQLLREGLRSITDPSVSRFFCEDLPQLMRKLSPEQKTNHFATVDEYLRGLIRDAGIRLRIPEPVAVSVIKLLVQCAAQNIGRDANREDAIDVMAEALCKHLVLGAQA